MRPLYSPGEREGKGCEKDDKKKRGPLYIAQCLKTIEMSLLRRKREAGAGEKEDRQIFTRHKAVEQPPHRSSLLRGERRTSVSRTSLPPLRKVYRNGRREV